MKRALLLSIAVLGACLLCACHSENSRLLSNDSIAETTDTTRNSDIIIGKDDAQFVTRVAAGCLAEIQIGKLAKLKGKDKRIKNFGAMMVKDLTKGHGRVIALAQSKKIILPDAVTAEAQASIDSLSAKSGKDFDRAYLGKVKTDYQKALYLFETTSKGAFDPQIKQFAAKNILTIQRHLDLIDAMYASMQ